MMASQAMYGMGLKHGNRADAVVLCVGDEE